MTEHDCTRTEYPRVSVWTRPGDEEFRSDGNHVLVPHRDYHVIPQEVHADLWRRANQSVFWTILERLGLRGHSL